MRKVFGLSFLAIAVIMTGCSHFRDAKPEKIYTSNIGSGKTVVVIPFNNYINQVEAANKVEMTLVNYAFNVKSYQVDVKDVEKRIGVGAALVGTETKGAATDMAVAEAKGFTIERFKEYEKISADLSFEVLASNNEITVKVVRPKDKAVIGVASFEQGSFDEFQDFLLQKNLITEKAL